MRDSLINHVIDKELIVYKEIINKRIKSYIFYYRSYPYFKNYKYWYSLVWASYYGNPYYYATTYVMAIYRNNVRGVEMPFPVNRSASAPHPIAIAIR